MADAAHSRARLHPTDVVVETHGDIGSTQARMKDRIRSGDDVHGHVVRAVRQLAGSGTRGRAWASEAGGSYQTLAVRDAEGATRRLSAPGISVALGVGLASAFADAGAPVQVKWPNDLQLGGAKLGGILCEWFRGWLLVGVGVNVANPVPVHAAALSGWPLDVVHDLVIDGVLGGIALWTSGRDLHEAFAPYDALAGQHLVVRTGSDRATGFAGGVTPDGALLIDDRPILDGSVERIDGYGGC